MKGTFFQKPLELNLRIEGETWNQGDPVSGSLVIKNHGSEEVSLDEVKIQLAHGELKKVRLKSEDAFEILSSVPLQSAGKLEPGKEKQFPWNFQTDRNCSITDGSSSLFLLYGQGAPEKLGQLQLPFLPHLLLQEFLKIFEISFRFVPKTRKSAKDRIEVKLTPPSSRGFVTLEHLVLFLRFEGEMIEAQYVFHVKKVEASASSVDIKKQKNIFERTYSPDLYFLPSGRLNHDRMEAAIREALEQVESKIIL